MVTNDQDGAGAKKPPPRRREVKRSEEVISHLFFFAITAFDPIAFTEQGSRDTLVVEAGENEGVYLAPFDLNTSKLIMRHTMPSEA